MNKKTNKTFKKPMVAVASMVLCFCLIGIFRDITRWDGAVIGTSYDQATD